MLCARVCNALSLRIVASEVWRSGLKPQSLMTMGWLRGVRSSRLARVGCSRHAGLGIRHAVCALELGVQQLRATEGISMTFVEGRRLAGMTCQLRSGLACYGMRCNAWGYDGVPGGCTYACMVYCSVPRTLHRTAPIVW